MRITKVWLRLAKERLRMETKRIMGLSDPDVIAEHRKIYPAMDADDGHAQYVLRRELIYAAIERIIPSSIVD